MMKRVLVALVLVANPLMAADQTDVQRIEEATAALPQAAAGRSRGPRDLRSTAADRTRREGRNEFVCFPDDGEPDLQNGLCGADRASSRRGSGPDPGAGNFGGGQAGTHVSRRSKTDRWRRRSIMVSNLHPQRTGPRADRIANGDLPSRSDLPSRPRLPTERSDGTWLMCHGSPGAHIMVADWISIRSPRGALEDLRSVRAIFSASR